MEFIGKQLACQKFIYKIHSARLRQNRWNLTMTVDEARRNDEVISLADSQILRWIDELNGLTDADEKAREIKAHIRRTRRSPHSVSGKRAIRKLYHDLDELQFKPDYMCLIIDREKDYHRACRGFSINGVRYQRLLGTNGGIKNSTIVFVSERLAPELRRRIENGRDQTKKLVTAKLEAYKALTCSASVPVSMPRGVIVVDDAETQYVSDIIALTDEGDGEPVMEARKDEPITMDASDGFGLMLPSLAERWSGELGLDYVMSGCNTRFSFEKGMVFTFDFLDFAEKVAGTYTIRDAWGDERDVRDAELILTTSMVKLYDSYPNCESYVQNSLQNGYTFGVPKSCPKELESERSLNYQFIQSYDLTDEEIDELIGPTMRDTADALGDDWRKAILYLKGIGLNDSNVERMHDDFIKAAMVDERMLDDPYVRSSIYQLIRNRINQAKVGVVEVHGNYSIVSGDPYLLCQSMFGLEKTGLLKAGEIYNRYWADCGAERLACFRAPMTCHNNIRLVHPVNREDVRYWFRYISTATIINGWDTMCAALNGMDMDGDLVMLTDNRVLVEKLVPMPALMCAQRKAEKRISEEVDFIRSNIESFGNSIGQTTNWITSMFEVRSHFEKGSEEYETLSYRIRCGQLYQQNEIDKAKGIVCKPMVKSWHDRHECNRIEDEKQREFYRRIVADRKPYFMRYIYPALMKQYHTYIKNTDRNAMREFQMTVADLEKIPEEERTERQNEFLKYFRLKMPVGMGDCVMNRICRKFEDAFDGYVGKYSAGAEFDYRIMRSDAEYLPKQYSAVKKLFDEYNRRVINYQVFADYERVDEYTSFAELNQMDDEFRKECAMICPDAKALCNIVLDLCYTKNATKRFAWNMCGEEIVRNLQEKNGNIIRYPAQSEDGEIQYGGRRFTIREKELTAEDDDCAE